MTRLRAYWPLVLALGVSLAFRVVLLAVQAVPFNSDEAIVALMARHITQGARPVFFYGQAYMGSLDAWLVAGMYRLIGEGVLAVRAVQVALYLLYMASVYALALRWFAERRVAVIAVLLTALPPVLVTTYTTASLGGYGESLLFGNAILWLGWAVTYGGSEDDWRYWAALGLVGGVAFWTLAIAGVYLLPVALLGLMRFRWRRWPLYLLAAATFLVGCSPWWLYNILHDNAALYTIISPNDPKTGVGKIELSMGERAIGFFFLGLPALLGLRPPWSAEFLPWPLALVVTMVYAGVAAYHVLSWRRGLAVMATGSRRLLALLTLGFGVIFIGTHFGTDASGRYFLPLYVVVALATAAALNALWTRRRALAGLALAAVLGVNLFGNTQAALSPDKITTQFDPISRFDNRYDAEVIDFLLANGLTRGYSNYWVTFRLAFLSQERLQYSARLPYKEDQSYTPADNRYAPYIEAVEASSRVAYITTLHPALDERIRQGLAALQVAFSENAIGPYRIFYSLSRRVAPEELGLGQPCCR
jgi:4-amino-4-deoxy-L-arabinose transferase-like glycosyltransferase